MKGRVFTQLHNFHQFGLLSRVNRYLCTEVNKWKVLKNSDNLRKERTDTSYCALKVWACNAGGGVPFTDAFISFGPEEQDPDNIKDREGAFEAWKSTKGKFRALTILEPSIKRLELFDSGMCRNGLRGKLVGDAVKCLKNFEKQIAQNKEKLLEVFQMMKNPSNEAVLQALLATHVFSHLVPLPVDSEKYKIDKQRFPRTLRECPCGCGSRLILGDTSFGNQEVWYGYPDIVIDRCTVTVELEDPESYLEYDDCTYEDDVALDEKYNFNSMTTIEVKRKVNSDNINDSKVFSQFIAQAITNSFFQSKLDQGLGEFLIPSFLVTNTKVFICMYCVEHDLLFLRWPPLDLWDKIHETLNMETVFEVWMTLNFDRLGSPVSENILKYVDKYNLRSEFPKLLEQQRPGSLERFKHRIASPYVRGFGNTWGDLNVYGFAETDYE